MPKPVVFAFLIEAALIFFTSILLAQPRLVFHSQSVRIRNAAMFSGYFLLCVTFCWSVIFGIILSLHRLTFVI